MEIYLNKLIIGTGQDGVEVGGGGGRYTRHKNAKQSGGALPVHWHCQGQLEALALKGDKFILGG